MFMQEPFVELMEFILEDTMFNLMEEATYEEFDLTQPPKIYIRKDQWWEQQQHKMLSRPTEGGIIVVWNTN